MQGAFRGQGLDGGGGDKPVPVIYFELFATSFLMLSWVRRTLARISSVVAVHWNGRGLAFQEAMQARMIRTRIWTEAKVPRRMAWRVMMPNQVSSGSPGALLCRAP
jgi:hypothetical protein